MSDPRLLDQLYSYTMKTTLEKGVAPHYLDVARDFSMKPEEGRAAYREMIECGIPAWFYSDTDYVASFAPFNTVPTQYLISVDGEQKWYGQ